MKSLKLTLTITGKRLELLKLLARSDDPKKLTSTAKKLSVLSIDRAGKAILDCIAAANDTQEDEA